MAKAKESLEEGLDRSASKRHLTGAARHRYIGGALHNMGKSKPRSGGKKKAAAVPKEINNQHTPPKLSKPKKLVEHKAVRAKEQIVLTAKLNSAASKGKPYNVYSIYKGGSLYSNTTYRKMSTAKAEAKIEQDAHNFGYKRGRF